MSALAPAWTQASYADALTNEALTDLERKLSRIVLERRDRGWSQDHVLALQRHVLAVALSEISAADRRRGGPPPPAPEWLLIGLRRWRLAR